MVFKVFENGKLIGIINNALFDKRYKPHIKISGLWEGLFPFASIGDSKTPLELRGNDSHYENDIHITGAVLTGKKVMPNNSQSVLVTFSIDLTQNPSESLEDYFYLLNAPPAKKKRIPEKPALRLGSIIAKKEYYQYDEKLFTQRIIDKAYEVLEKYELGDEMNNLEHELQGANLFKTLKILQEYFFIF